MRIIEAMRYKVVGNKQCVIDHLTFSSDKDEARQLLFLARPSPAAEEMT